MREVVMCILSFVLLLWIAASLLYADVDMKVEKLLAMPIRTPELSSPDDGRCNLVLLEEVPVVVEAPVE